MSAHEDTRRARVIPRPLSLKPSGGRASWTPGETAPAISASGGCEAVAASLASWLGRASGRPWTVSGDAASAFVTMVLEPESDATRRALGDEGYALKAGQGRVECRAASQAGLFYAAQTLRQLLPAEGEKAGGLSDGFSLPGFAISDRPRFAWRGFMLDEARHFHGVAEVKRLLDLMALHKLNVFHWHLNDDQGWRVEIRRYPKLTETGSRRADTVIGGTGSQATAGEPYGGFYTQAEIRDVVAYAAERFITVVPEFELPGHASAALASYPELGCTGGPYAVRIGPGIFEDIYCAGKESTFAFVEGVLEELLELFPSKFIHLGGDEAPKARWKACPDCRARMAAEGLSGEEELQTWFFNRVASWLAARGRTAMGWNEILGDALVPGAAAQFWMGDRKALVRHVKRGRKVVMSDFYYAYLDYDYRLHPLAKAYAYEPVPWNVPSRCLPDVLGMEAPLWTEWVRDRAALDYQTFPRLCAHAETAWTANRAKDYADFEKRLLRFLPRLDALGVSYAPSGAWNPGPLERLANNARFWLRLRKARRAERSGD